MSDQDTSGHDGFDQDRAPPCALTPLEAALRNRCMRCGEAPASEGFLKTVEICPVCGADYRRHAAGDGAVYIVLTTLCILVMAAVVGIEFAYRPPVWAHALIGLALTLGLAFVFLPPVKRFMVAQSYSMDARGEGWAQDEDEDETGAQGR